MSLEITKPVIPTKEGPINTYKIGNQTYIPLNVVPKVYKPIFQNKPVKVTPKTVSTTDIKVNDKFYKPFTSGVHKTVTVDGIKYIPV